MSHLSSAQARSLRHALRRVQVAVFIATMICGPALAGVGQVDITSLSIEDLMDIEITSVSKRPEALSDAAAAVFVITSDDIRRSGVTNIPEALRLAPGLQVARIDANKWAITSRGFGGRFSNKLLVLIDGRSVYTPLFSGVYWDEQDTLIEDVERIEVIRGPGATLWGANAVNGVINIITRSAVETQGTLAVAGAGTEEKAFAGARFGATVGDSGHYRLYAKYFNRDGAVDTNGNDTNDGWENLRGGFRVDGTAASGDAFTFQGDAYWGKEKVIATTPTYSPPYTAVYEDENTIQGGNLLMKWRHTVSPTSQVNFQAYYDRIERRGEALISEHRDTFDLDVQHEFALGERHEFLWGLGYRVTRDHTTDGGFGQLPDTKRIDTLVSGFIQDDIALVPNRLRLTVGSKIEYNDYTGREVQPNIRLLWTPSENHTVWGAVSRAVRTPSRGEDEGVTHLTTIPPGSLANPGPLPIGTVAVGNDDLEAEELIAYELGYRVRPFSSLFLDVAAFINDYDDLRSIAPGTAFPSTDPNQPPHLIVPMVFQNGVEGQTYGVEAAVDWHTFDWWRWQGTYTYLTLDLHAKNAFFVKGVRQVEGWSPRHQFSLRSSMDLPANVELDLWLRYVDEIPEMDVDRYTTLDARVGWQTTPNMTFSLTGQNLLESHHLEATPELGVGNIATEVERSVYGKVEWRF